MKSVRTQCAERRSKKHDPDKKGGEEEMKQKRNVVTLIYFMILAVTVTLIQVGPAFALARPTGGFAQDLYTIAVDDILGGPIGFVGGIGTMAVAAILAIRMMFLPAVGAVLGGAFLLRGDNIVESLGMMVL